MLTNKLSVFSGLILIFSGKQKPSDGQEHLVGLSDDVGVGFIPGHGNQPASSSSELTVDRATDLPGQDETGLTGVSKVIRADQKRFFFDLGNNNRGHFLRISEVIFLEETIFFFCCCLLLRALFLIMHENIGGGF